ncbi:MAG: hypothetical protein ABL958_09985 [Bdellovibrionia bacterium]
MGATYYDLAEPLPSARPLDDKNFTLDHFYAKLFKLPDLMNTQSGKSEGKRRVEFMRAFVDHLMSEI